MAAPGAARFGVEGQGFRVQGAGFRVQGVGCGFSDLVARVESRGPGV